MTDSAENAPRTPTLVERWLSPEGYLGLHLLIGFVAALLAGMAFVQIADRVFDSDVTLAVDAAAQTVARELQSPWLNPIMHAASFVGAAGPLTFLTVVVLVWLAVTHARRRLAMFAAVMVVGPLLNNLLKSYYQRARPEGWDHMLASGYSFPSGHSMGSMLFFGALAYVLYVTAETHHVIRVLLVAACLSAAALIGCSRVYLGVHWFSDVLAGFAAALCWVAVCVSAVEGWLKLRQWREVRRARRRA